MAKVIVTWSIETTEDYEAEIDLDDYDVPPSCKTAATDDDLEGVIGYLNGNQGILAALETEGRLMDSHVTERNAGNVWLVI